MELHTFSSLNQEFLKQYDGSMKMADKAYVYFDPKAIEHKKLAMIKAEDVQKAFNSSNVEVFTSSQELVTKLKNENYRNKNLLLMSSGNFGGVNLEELAKEILS